MTRQNRIHRHIRKSEQLRKLLKRKRNFAVHASTLESGGKLGIRLITGLGNTNTKR